MEQPKSTEPDSQNNLPLDHFLVHITQTALPSYADLQSEFGQHNVGLRFADNPSFYHPVSGKVVKTIPGVREMFVRRTERQNLPIEWYINQMRPLGYRAATPVELHAFIQDRRQSTKYRYLVALGACIATQCHNPWCYRNYHREVAVFINDGLRCSFINMPFEDLWFANVYLLFVKDEQLLAELAREKKWLEDFQRRCVENKEKDELFWKKQRELDETWRGKCERVGKNSTERTKKTQ